MNGFNLVELYAYLSELDEVLKEYYEFMKSAEISQENLERFKKHIETLDKTVLMFSELMWEIPASGLPS